MRRFELWSAIRPAKRAMGDDKGATAVEFAIVVVPFFGLLLLILQVGLFHFSLQSLDFAVRQAGRMIMTGQVATGSSSAATFKTTYVCPNVFWGMSCDKLVINSYIVGKTSDAATGAGVYSYIDAKAKALLAPQTNPTQQKFCLGAPGDYVYLDVAYPYPNYVRKLLGADSPETWVMRSSTVVYNEPNKKNAGASC